MAKKIERKKKIIAGSRGSRLALAQTGQILAELAKRFPDYAFSLKIIKTKGDKLINSPLSKIGGKGIFVKELESALMRREIDLAVHSLKDLPTEIPEKLAVGAITRREDPRDVMIAKSFSGSENVIGTSSLRRRSQLLAWRPDLKIIELRGNLDTRIKKMLDGEVQAIVVARAGIERLNIKREKPGLSISTISISRILPAPGQGALAIEVRKDDDNILKMVRALNHVRTSITVSAERALLLALGGGCQVPIGAFASINGNRLLLKGIVASLDGKTVIKSEMYGNIKDPIKLGAKLAVKLKKMGADNILR